jgi:uncharacterized Zn-finger protein
MKQNHSSGVGEKKLSPFVCSICEKEFKTKNSLNDHQSLHLGNKDFSCQSCPKKFRLKQALVRHYQAVHLDLKFECEICGETMKLRKQFQRTYIDHIKSRHENELSADEFESLKSKIKMLRFKDVSNKAPTVELDGTATMFSKQCPDCYLTFGNNAILMQHIEKCHPHNREMK